MKRKNALDPRLPSFEGGDTLICNTYEAYDDLPEEDKVLIQNLRVRHALESTQRMVNSQPTVAELSRWRMRPSQTDPLVWRHQSGRDSLLLGATAQYVEGMSIEDRAMLLCGLQEFCTQEQYVYRHQWTVGDLLVSDNTDTMHRATDYPPRQRPAHDAHDATRRGIGNGLKTGEHGRSSSMAIIDREVVTEDVGAEKTTAN